MVTIPSEETTKPVVKGASYFLAQVPSMICYGSKPYREMAQDPSLRSMILSHTWNFDKAVGYPPNQVFIGNLDPDDLKKIPIPWHQHLMPDASRWGAFGEMMPEEEFYGLMKICDEFGLMLLEGSVVKEIAAKLNAHPLFTSEDTRRLGTGDSPGKIQKKVDEKSAIPLYVQGSRLIGCLQQGHENDTALTPDVLLENLSAKASGVMALRHLIVKNGSAHDIDYLLGFGEEAVGDRYNRGGGNLAKAIGERCGCSRATGADVKAFCCAPVHALVMAAGLISSKIFNNVVLVGGGSLAKLGMKFQGHLRHDMPILEEALAAIAIWVGQDDGISPVIRLDSIGKHEIGAGSSQQAILEKLVARPLDRLGIKLTQIDKYATEMHNPEITEPQGSGNVPRTNYRTIGSLAVLRKEIRQEELDHFVEAHGMLGFSPTQGHIASAVPVLGHAVKNILEGKIDNTMFLAKGSLFLGRMTQLSDGISFLLEKNKGNGR